MSRIHDAVRKGDVALTEQLLRGGFLRRPVDVNETYHYAGMGADETPLGIAVANGNGELARLLMERGADVSAATHGGTPLHLAIKGGHTDLAKLLVERGTNVDSTTTDGYDETPLHLAVQGGHTELVKLLIGKGASLSAAGRYGNSPLHYAFTNKACHLEAAKVLLDAGADVNARNRNDWPPIGVACGNPSPVGVNLLLQRGADPGAASSDGTTPLHHSSALGHTEVMKLLLAAGAQVDVRDGKGFTPLTAAESLGKYQAVRILRSHRISKTQQEPEELVPAEAKPTQPSIGAEPGLRGRIAGKLRESIHDFDISQEEGIARLRRLCAEDPDMTRVPEGIEDLFFLFLKTQLEVAQRPDYGEPAGLWEANLDWADKENKPAQQPPAGVQPETIQIYNHGVSLYQKCEFRAAMDAFTQVFESGELKMQAAYARGLCQKELGLAVEIPSELGGKAEEVGAVYVASNLVCHLIARGHEAELTKEGYTSEVTALIGDSLYTISISSLLGTFNNWAWRQEGGKSISIPDPDENPDPTENDRLVISLAEQAGALPPFPMPDGGLSTIWG